ncbi:hypothetical protein MRB53_015917 [Persea americana]|uniref:Uncharacterized protein n=1 Tax=Persea americana TaxID=3435 RepID=A0ACC2M179_PERAE|nr:hypothetical protein MRB53_015917 [Persea americana]
MVGSTSTYVDGIVVAGNGHGSQRKEEALTSRFEPGHHPPCKHDDMVSLDRCTFSKQKLRKAKTARQFKKLTSGGKNSEPKDEELPQIPWSEREFHEELGRLQTYQ